MACLGSVLLYRYHFSHNGKRIHVETDDDLHRRPLPAPAARRKALRLCAPCTPSSSMPEHEFNASTFTAASSPAPAPLLFSASLAPSVPCAGPKQRRRQMRWLRDPETLRESGRGRGRHPCPHREERGGHRFRPPVYAVSDPRNQVIKEVARELSQEQRNTKMFDIAERLESTMWEAKKMFPEPRLVPAPSATT